MVFMIRSRMFPTKANFQHRWSESILCIYCCNVDTDEHLFNCCGYMDLIHDSNINYAMFWNMDVPMDLLSVGAKTLLHIHDRLVTLHEDKELNA